MTKKQSSVTKRTLDLSELTAEQKARLDAVVALPDDQISYKDAPYLPNAVWLKAASQLPVNKQQITLRLDAEVLEFFKNMGARYQSRINAVLLSYVHAHKAQLAHAK